MNVQGYRINKRSAFGKWFIGYESAGGWTGRFTVQQTWEKQFERKPKGCSWQAWGIICAREINPRFGAIAEMQEEMDYYKDLLIKKKIDFIG